MDDAGFVDGQFWVGLGDAPSLRDICARLAQWLRGEHLTSVETARAAAAAGAEEGAGTGAAATGVAAGVGAGCAHWSADASSAPHSQSVAAGMGADVGVTRGRGGELEESDGEGWSSVNILGASIGEQHAAAAAVTTADDVIANVDHADDATDNADAADAAARLSRWRESEQHAAAKCAVVVAYRDGGMAALPELVSELATLRREWIAPPFHALVDAVRSSRASRPGSRSGSGGGP